MIFGIILAVIVFASLAMLVRDGVWSNTVLLVLVVLSGLIAFGFYQPITALIDEQSGGTWTYALDIVVLWFLYAVVFSVLRAICDALSTHKMKFDGPVNDVVGPIVGLLVGVALAGFTGATLHTAPLPRDGLSGGMDYSETSLAEAPFYSLDAQWLYLVEAASSAGLGVSEPFDAEEFVALYGLRRERLSKQEKLRVERGT